MFLYAEEIPEPYLTNLGKYNEGRLAGAPLNFPTTEEVQALLKRIRVDGVRYGEIFITNFESDILGLYDHLGEYESIDELTTYSASAGPTLHGPRAWGSAGSAAPLIGAC